MITIPHLLPISDYLKNKLPGYCGTICIDGSDDPNNKVFDFKSLVLADHTADLPEVNRRDIAVVPFSSGTSGLPVPFTTNCRK